LMKLVESNQAFHSMKADAQVWMQRGLVQKSRRRVTKMPHVMKSGVLESSNCAIGLVCVRDLRVNYRNVSNVIL
jgi:hypothetical protein